MPAGPLHRQHRPDRRGDAVLPRPGRPRHPLLARRKAGAFANPTGPSASANLWAFFADKSLVPEPDLICRHRRHSDRRHGGAAGHEPGRRSAHQPLGRAGRRSAAAIAGSSPWSGWWMERHFRLGAQRHSCTPLCLPPPFRTAARSPGLPIALRSGRRCGCRTSSPIFSTMGWLGGSACRLETAPIAFLASATRFPAHCCWNTVSGCRSSSTAPMAAHGGMPIRRMRERLSFRRGASRARSCPGAGCRWNWSGGFAASTGESRRWRPGGAL